MKGGNTQRKQKGFTLIETTVAIALLLIVLGIAAPKTTSFFRMRGFEERSDRVIGAVLKARDQATFRKEPWGVKFLTTEYTLFKGMSYTTREPTRDERFALPAAMTVNRTAHSDEIVFGSSGAPQNSLATIEITEGLFSRIVHFNEYGAETKGAIINNSASPPQKSAGTLDAYWNLNEVDGTRRASADTYGSYNLTPPGGLAPGSAAGKIGMALAMETGKSMRNVGGVLGNANRDFTVAAWIRLVSPASANLVMGIKDQTNALSWLLHYDSEGRIVFKIPTPTGDAAALAPFNADDGWHLIVSSYDAAAKRLSISVDGGAGVTATGAGIPSGASGGIMIGADATGDLIDELGVWAKVLSPEEIAKLWNNGVGITAPFSGPLGPRPVELSESIPLVLNPAQCNPMSSTVIKYPLSATQDTTSPSTSWNTPENALTADGIPATTSNVSSPPTFTRTLRFRNFTPSPFIPNNDNSIQGVTIDIASLSGIDTEDSLVQIILPKTDGSIFKSVNKATGENISSGVPKTTRYGGVTDTWGIVWQPNDISAINAAPSNFGFDFAAKLHTSSSSLAIDGATMTICYQTPSPTIAGPRSGVTFTDSGGGELIWDTPSNAGLLDGIYTTAFWIKGFIFSNSLQARNFGFSIPSTATINGIEFNITLKADGGEVTDNSVKLVKAGIAVGNDLKRTGISWPVSDTTITFGGPTQLAGVAWTPADINDVNFGIDISTLDNSASKNAYIDYISAKVYYTTASASVYDTVRGFPRQIMNTFFCAILRQKCE